MDGHAGIAHRPFISEADFFTGEAAFFLKKGLDSNNNNFKPYREEDARDLETYKRLRKPI